ncbi:class F sortase [uncultured Serinicoccus sp.]|uniref:class F sortase n=1 Tax=uncultured Serinicoccus sp. TaxID=735514 RepID=UPI0026135B0F|nr:class F sortase [uncultured Serinicoccus sp.]
MNARLLLPTGLLVGALGVSALAVQAVGVIQGTDGRPVHAEGDAAPEWVTAPAAGLEEEPIAPEGLTPQGTINPDQGEAIWYVGSDRVVPGQRGTAVIAAHVTYYDEPDVFYDLAEVSDGDVVTVGYGHGGTRDFVITSTQQISKEGLQRSEAVWGDQDEVARIALITCDPSLGARSDGGQKANFVAIAEAVDG